MDEGDELSCRSVQFDFGFILNKRFDRLLYSFCRHIPTILIVCPTSVKHKWIHDFDDDFFLFFFRVTYSILRVLRRTEECQSLKYFPKLYTTYTL